MGAGDTLTVPVGLMHASAIRPRPTRSPSSSVAPLLPPRRSSPRTAWRPSNGRSHPDHPCGVAAPHQADHRPRVRTRGRCADRGGRLQPHRRRGHHRDRQAAEGGGCRSAVRRRAEQDQLRHLHQGPPHRLCRRQLAPPAQGSRAGPELPRAPGASRAERRPTSGPKCVGEIAVKTMQPLKDDIDNFQAALDAQRLSRGLHELRDARRHRAVPAQ